MDSSVSRSPTLMRRLASRLSGRSNEPGPVASVRMARAWRKSGHLPTKTVDEEFEDLVEELDAVNDACVDILEVHKRYVAVCKELVNSSSRAVNTVHLLTVPTRSSVEEERNLRQASDKCKTYSAVLHEINLCLNDSLTSISNVLDKRFETLVAHSQRIYEHICTRDKALSNFDKVYEKYDSLTVLGATNEFTPKQKQFCQSLEGKLDRLKADFDGYNTTLKMELPYYFMLVRSFIEPVTQFLFYVHLTVSHQFNSNLMTLHDDFDKLNSTYDPTFAVSIISRFEAKYALPDPDLKVLKSLKRIETGSVSEESFKSSEDVQLIPSETRKPKEADQKKIKEKPESPSPQIIPAQISESDEITYWGRALLNFQTSEKGDLNFNKDDVIRILDADGDWWIGMLGEKKGLFPRNYVKVFTETNPQLRSP